MSDDLARSIENVVTLNGAMGDCSLGLCLTLIATVSLTLTVLSVMLIAKLRWQPDAVVALCVMDVLIGFACAFLVLPFLGAFFFIGRAFWRALTTPRPRNRWSLSWEAGKSNEGVFGHANW